MGLKVYNTLSRKKEEFAPQEKNKVKMYVCGITPYDQCHLGHARCYLVFDVVRRWLEYKGFAVNYVENFTDVDDKIIARSRQDLKNAESAKIREKVKEISDKYIRQYLQYREILNIKKATKHPRVSENIPEIIKIVQGLVEKGYAYLRGGNVYFEVTKFKDYGNFSHRPLEQMMPGARVKIDKQKKSPLDFALWKTAKENEPSWESPWGRGRPGWHIECAAMSMKCLETSTLDIHGGGEDLIFPHHQNEIAQSEAYTGKQFVKYWLHNAFVMVNKEKMSKSLQNFFTIQEVLEHYEPMVLRFFLISNHYRQPLDYSDKELETSSQGLNRLRIFKTNLNFLIESLDLSSGESFREKPEKQLKTKKEMESKIIEQFKNTVDSLKVKFEEAMDDDFNTPQALGHLYEIVRQGNIFASQIPPGVSNIAKVIETIRHSLRVFDQLTQDILGLKIELRIPPADIRGLIQLREEARQNKDWERADKIRRELKDKGILIEDTPFGPRPLLKQ